MNNQDKSDEIVNGNGNGSKAEKKRKNGEFCSGRRGVEGNVMVDVADYGASVV
jgi:hypothetical protein